MFVVDKAGTNLDPAITRTRIGKSIYGIYNQVENDLLQLDAITFDNQRIGNEGSLHGDVMGCSLRRQNADHFAYNFIQVDILRFDCGLGKKSTEPLYHTIRPLIGALDIGQN